MTAKLEKVLSDLDKLSKADLKIVQKHVSEKLEQKESLSSSNSTRDKGEKSVDLSKIGYVMTSQELKHLLFSFLTPEEWTKLDKNEVSSPLPTLPRPIQEYIDEDREDRI